MSAESDRWLLIAKTPDYALATWHHVFCVIWRAETTLQGAAHLQASSRAFAAQHPRGIGLLTIVESGALMPPPAARKAVSDFLKHAGAFVKCSAVIFEGSGFRAAAVRSVVTGLTLVARQPFPHRVCHLEEAIRMFSTTLRNATGQPVDGDLFRTSLQELRNSIVAREKA